MRIANSLALSVLIAAGVTSAAVAAVKVNFVSPEHYTDANLYYRYGAKAKDQTFRQIRAELERLAARYLAPDETITIDILDIDLAGRFEPWNFPYDDIRYIRDITWPRIKLSYTLSGGARSLSGEETVSDPMYLMTPNVSSSGEPLRYEKAMLDRWFKLRFGDRGNRARS